MAAIAHLLPVAQCAILISVWPAKRLTKQRAGRVSNDDEVAGDATLIVGELYLYK